MSRRRTQTMKGDGTRIVSDRVTPHVLAGLATALALLCGFGGWAATTEIAGAVIASGTVVVEGYLKKVQHPTGGIVGEIHVKDGDLVKAGDVLVRLDETLTRTNLQIIAKQLDELAMRQIRLKSERDGADAVGMPTAFIGREQAEDVREIVAGERLLFASRRNGRVSQVAQLRERITQLKEEITGLAAQQSAKKREITLVQTELGGLEKLEHAQLTTTNRMTVMRRDLARLDGEHGQLVATAAQAAGKIAETELQLLQVEENFKADIVKELREVQTKEAEYVERRVVAEDNLKRAEVRAPQGGLIHQLSVHTAGAVINAADQIMQIVPLDDRLVVEARMEPQHIDQVKPGLDAFVRFTAFSQRTTPEINGTVQSVSADLARDAATNVSYYIVRIAFQEAELRRLGQLKLVPGMPAEVQIKTGDRTALSYLVKPLADQISRAFRER